MKMHVKSDFMQRELVSLDRRQTCNKGHNNRDLNHPRYRSPGMRSHELTFTWWGCCGSCQRHKPSELAHSFLFCFCVYFCLYGPFSCISFHKFSRQLPAFSLCSPGLISAIVVLSTTYLFMKVSLSPDIILCA